MEDKSLGTIPKTVGERIKQLRKNKGESQAKLGEVIGLSQNSISKLENNETQLTLENQCNLVKHFNISHDYLITGKDNNSLLTTLTNFISMKYNDFSVESNTYYCPSLVINKALFDYIKTKASAENIENMSPETKKTWIDEAVKNFYEINGEEASKESIEIIPLPQNLLFPDDNRKDWKQSDLIREMNHLF